MNPKLRTTMNYEPSVDRYEFSDGSPSITVPDQAPSIRTLLHRMATGVDVKQFETGFSGDAAFPNLSKLEAAELRSANSARINDLQQTLQNHVSDQKRANATRTVVDSVSKDDNQAVSETA